MCTIATAKVQRNYNCYNVYFNECLRCNRLGQQKKLRGFSSRSLIKNSCRVPAYQNLKIIVGFCDYLFKPLANDWREVWRVVRSLP